MESYIPELEQEIDEMIEKREKAPKRIENMLDLLLDYLHMGIGEEQFIKLNTYYGSFCPTHSAQYDAFYHDTVGE